MSPPKEKPQDEAREAGARWFDAAAEAERLEAEAREAGRLGPAGAEGVPPPLGVPEREPQGPKLAPLLLLTPERMGLEAELPTDSAAPALGAPDVPVTGGGAKVVEALRQGGALDRPAEPGEAGEAHVPMPRRRGRKRRLLARPLVWAFDVAVLCVVALILAILLTAGRELPAPGWLAERVQARLNEGLGGATVEMGGLYVVFSRTALPRVSFRDVDIRAPDGTHIVHVPALGATLDKAALMQGRIQPRGISITGAAMRAERDAEGNFDLQLGDVAMSWEGTGSLAGLLGSVDRMLALPSFAPIDEISADNLVLEFFDARTGREWVLYDGTLTIAQAPEQVSVRLALQLAADAVTEDARDAAAEGAGGAGSAAAELASGDTGAAFDIAPAAVTLSFVSQKGSSAAELSASVEGVAAQDIATLSPATAFLGLIDAPISGSMRAQVDVVGGLEELAGRLEIGAGAIDPGQGQAAIGFDGGRSYFRYQPERARLVFDELRLAAPDGAFTASGQAYLEGMEETGWPTDLVGQLAFSDVAVNPEGVFADGLAFQSGALDLKLSLDPLRLRIGQMVLSGEEVTLRAKGGARPVPEGWEAAIDLEIDRIDHEQLLTLWPLALAPNTRDWIAERVQAGELFNVAGALRARPGETRPVVSLVYEFRDAKVLPLPTLPPVEGASGYSSISDGAYTLSLDAGHMDAPEGGRVDVAGSVLRVPDVHQEPADMEVHLVSESSATAVLSILDQEPWRFMSKAGQPVDIAEGRAALDGVIRFPLIKDVPKEVIAFRVGGVLTGVRSERVVPGRTLTAERLEVLAHGEEIVIEGAGRIEGLPITAAWVQPIDKPGPQPSRVEGTIELSQAFVDRFNIGLPDGMVSGTGTGQFTIDLARGQAPRFSLRSDLNRMGLAIRELAWSMGASAKGSLQVEGQLGEPPVIERLSLTAPGLSAEGRVTLNAGGGLRTAEFSRVQAGRWIDAPVTLTGRGKGATPAVTVQGGWVDIRQTSFAQGSGGGTAGAPMTLALDRLVISDSISLTGFRADLTTRGGLNGTFRGAVNGAAPVSGSVVPVKGKTAVRIASDDAGRVFRAAGLFKKGQGGAMQLTLVPRPEPGQYNGELRVKNVRVQSAPGLAALLNAISVVGLLEQANGPGLLFSNTEVDFRLTPNAVQISHGSAVGPSVGISMAGVYDMNRDYMAVQGVFSPIYVLNGIGRIISKKGEGFFGFNYKMTGPASGPKVTVNPLSVLTPGIFREIFRQPPPKLGN
ncbi:AsmA-like C-terminal region-containing protein [Vannielia litorea]|uniref:AsmA-like C-terminal region n=1 Tax=Vannielia litorea TaxID=1217970 RepID=A0A1N6EQW1_9RHOB|nr:AsmA-like C-terminal region-containing protein [Vannielia litorea]SIN85479.1 AsmA-like C-terminal region [Vannielia litorea]